MKNLKNIPKKKCPAFEARRFGDAIPGGVT
jgi:hypothetical protein